MTLVRVGNRYSRPIRFSGWSWFMIFGRADIADPRSTAAGFIAAGFVKIQTRCACPNGTRIAISSLRGGVPVMSRLYPVLDLGAGGLCLVVVAQFRMSANERISCHVGSP